LHVKAHRILNWSIVVTQAAVGLVIAIWIWHSEAWGVGLLLGAPTSLALLLVLLRRAPKWSIVVASAAVGLVFAILIWYAAYPAHPPAEGGTDLEDGAFGLGALLGAPTSFVALPVLESIEASGIELPVGPFGMALWLAVVPVNWALLAVIFVMYNSGVRQPTASTSTTDSFPASRGGSDQSTGVKS
jgi:hypothetical protein